MKTTLLYLLLFFSCYKMNAQTAVPVRSINQAIEEIKKGNLVSLSLLNDPSKTFPKSFFKIPKDKLTGLIIDGCDYKKIPKKIAQYKSIRYFRYSWFRFDAAPITNVPTVLFELTKLKSLVFESEIIGDISNEISNLKELELLELYGTKLEEFPKAILALKNLKVLNLACANFISIPAEISQLKKLVSLKFDGGGCGATPISEIPDTIGELTALKSISFGYTEEGLRYLPVSFFKLENLEYFGCFGCGLMGFPEEVGLLVNLKSIQMMNMNSFDVFPESLFKLPMLQKFTFLIPGGKASKALTEQKKRLNIWGADLESYQIEIEHY